MRILTVPEDTAVLRSKSQPVREIDPELVKFLRDLGKTLKRQKDPAGVGLSAIQVGRSIRAFAIFLPDQRKKEEGRRKRGNPELVFYINPEIISHPKEMTLGEDLVEDNAQRSTFNVQRSTFKARPFLEGCLSIPDIYGPVLRWPWIKAKATILRDSDLISFSFGLQPSAFSLEKLASRVFQHELDHLNGILFTDHVLAQGNKLYQDSGNGLEEVNL